MHVIMYTGTFFNYVHYSFLSYAFKKMTVLCNGVENVRIYKL